MGNMSSYHSIDTEVMFGCVKKWLKIAYLSDKTSGFKSITSGRLITPTE